MTSTELITEVINYSTIAANAIGVGGGIMGIITFTKNLLEKKNAYCLIKIFFASLYPVNQGSYS